MPCGAGQAANTIAHVPAATVAAGSYAQTIDHLNVLADVLQRYGALDGFRHDFRAAFDTPEAARAYANLPPLTQVFSPPANAAPAP